MIGEAFKFKKLEQDILIPMFCGKDEHDETEIMRCLYNLAEYPEEDMEKLVNYIIRTKIRYDGEPPKEEKFNQIYESIKTLDFYEVIRRNINICEKMEKNNDPDFQKYFQGLEKTLSLFCEPLYRAVASFFEDEQAREWLLGKEMKRMEFKSLETFLEESIDRIFLKLEVNAKPMMQEYMEYKVNQPDFNCLQEPLFNELVELNFSKNLNMEIPDITILEEEKREGWLEEKKNQITEFIKNHKNKPVIKEEEENFSEFLKNIGFMKFRNENNVLSQGEIDFLLTQAIRKDSIVNQQREKYLPVIETTLMDFAKNDYMNRTGENTVSYVYSIRDYLIKNSNNGLHFEEGQVKLKRDTVQNIFDGDLSVLDTIYHENEHMLQIKRKSKIPNNFVDYQMLREYAIEALWPKFYQKNYSFMYIEIDARKVGAELTANYLDNIVSENNIDELLENVGNSINELIEKSNQIIKAENEKIMIGEEKVNEAGEFKNISRILDELLNIDNEEKLKEIFAEYPGLEIEYDLSTHKKRSFNDLLNLTRTGKYDYEMMTEIIRTGESCYDISLFDENGLEFFDTLFDWYENLENITDDEKQCFMEIVKDNFSIILRNFNKEIVKINIYEMRGEASDNEFASKYLNTDLLKLHKYIEKFKEVMPESLLEFALSPGRDWCFYKDESFLQKLQMLDDNLVKADLFQEQKRLEKQNYERSFSDILSENGFNEGSIKRIQDIVKTVNTLDKKEQKDFENILIQKEIKQNEEYYNN